MRSCGCQRIIDVLEEEKEDIYDALLLARSMLQRHYGRDEYQIILIDRVIEKYADDISA